MDVKVLELLERSAILVRRTQDVDCVITECNRMIDMWSLRLSEAENKKKDIKEKIKDLLIEINKIEI